MTRYWWLGLLGAGVFLPSTTNAGAARTVSLHEHASLHITKREGSDLEARGAATGTLAGSLDLHIVVDSADRMSASFVGSSHAGTLSGRGQSSYVVSGNVLSYTGTVSISRGTGSYAHASGVGIHIEGAMNRERGTISMTISGEMKV